MYMLNYIQLFVFNIFIIFAPILCIFMLFYSYLAISAAVASEADFIFIPEDPADVNWQTLLCDKLLQVDK